MSTIAAGLLFIVVSVTRSDVAPESRTPVLERCPDLAKGNAGICIQELQAALLLRYDMNLTVDGVFGDQTLNAVLEVQVSTGQTPDGVVGLATKQVLRSTSPSQSHLSMLAPPH